MIIDMNRYNGGGGSGSGVTPAQVQQQINSALTPYWESGETKDYVDGAVSGISLEGYATSGDMQSAFTLISETQHVAAAGLNQLEGRIDELSGATPDLSAYYTSAQTEAAIAQAVSGLATEQYVQDALSGVNMDNYWTSAETQDAIDEALSAYTPTTGFSTINGSAITNGGNIVISGPDVSNYVTSAQVETQIVEKNYVTSAQVETQIVSKNYITSAETANFVTSTQVETQILEKNYVTSAQVETQIEAKNYVNSGDVKSQVEAYNYATVSQIPTVPTSNTAFTNDAGYITGYTETDPTVPAWAKASSKPTYTASEVGALPTGTTLDNVADGTTRKLSNYATTGKVNTLSNTVTAHTANTSIHVTTAQTSAWDGKQDAIADLETIRSNAAAGAAKVSNVQADWNTTATTDGSYIKNKPTIPTVPTSNTAFTNDAGYITDAAIENLVTSAQVETQITSKGYATVSQIPTVPTSNTAFTNDAGYITSAAIADKVSSTSVSTIWKGTAAQYDAITTKDPNTFYIIVNN